MLWQGNRDASVLEAEIPASVSCCDRDLAVCIDFQGCQASSCVEAWKHSLVSSSKWGVRPHFEVGQGSRNISSSARRESDLP